jgi:hypothetical protein
MEVLWQSPPLVAVIWTVCAESIWRDQPRSLGAAEEEESLARERRGNTDSRRNFKKNAQSSDDK